MTPRPCGVTEADITGEARRSPRPPRLGGDANPARREHLMNAPDHQPRPPIVEASGITKRFGPTLALNDVHLKVTAGRTHALVGRNGAGKSTLVSILTGLQ